MTAEPVTRAVAPPLAGVARPLFELVLDRIRRGADATGPGPRPAPDEALPLALARAGPPPEPSTAGPVSAVNLAEVAVALRRQAGAASVELTLAPDLGIKLTRAEQGVALLIEASPQTTVPADAELARLTGALRARGIAVASASVRAVRGAAQAGQAGRRAR